MQNEFKRSFSNRLKAALILPLPFLLSLFLFSPIELLSSEAGVEGERRLRISECNKTGMDICTKRRKGEPCEVLVECRSDINVF